MNMLIYKRIEEVFLKTNSIIVSAFDVDVDYPDSYVSDSGLIVDPTKRKIETQTDKLLSEFRLIQETDISDFQTFLKIKSTGSIDSYIRSYTFKFYDRKNEIIDVLIFTHKKRFIFRNERAFFNIDDSENFKNWIWNMIEQFEGMENSKIVGCKILALEKETAGLKPKPFKYSPDEKDAIKQMGEYIERFYSKKEFGKDKYDADDTPDDYIRSMYLPDIVFHKYEKKRKKRQEKLRKEDPEYYEMLENGIEIDSETLNELNEKLNPFKSDETDKKKELGEQPISSGIFSFPIVKKYNDEDFDDKPRHKIYLKKQQRYHLQLEENIESSKKKFPLPDFFYTKYDVFTYNVSCKYQVGFENKRPFGLFLAFKLRNTRPSEVHYWLDYFYERHGALFLAFIPKILLDYDFLFKKRKKVIKAISQWSAESKEEFSNLLNSRSHNETSEIIEFKISVKKKFQTAIYEDLKDYFGDGEKEKLLQLLEGKIVEEKITFKGVGAIFIRAIAELYKFKLFIGQRKDLFEWIGSNFRFMDLTTKVSKDFSDSTIKSGFDSKRKGVRSKKIEFFELKKLKNVK